MNNTEYNEILNTNSNHNTIAIIEDGRIVTYNNLIANINKLSIYLNELTLNIKDRICILLPNSIEYIISYYAINKLGTIIVPIDYNFKENTINHIIDDSFASFIISDDNNLKLLSKKK